MKNYYWVKLNGQVVAEYKREKYAIEKCVKLRKENEAWYNNIELVVKDGDEYESYYF